MACRHIDDIDVCIGVWLFDCLTVECEVEMVVPQLQPQEPKLKPPDSCRENETKSPHVRCLSEIPCRPRLWAPEPQIESLEQKPWRGTPVDRKLRRVAHLFQYTRVHILRLLASSPMSASSSSQVFHQRNELILVQNPWQDPSQDLTSKGKYFSRIFMAFWYLCKKSWLSVRNTIITSWQWREKEEKKRRCEDAKWFSHHATRSTKFCRTIAVRWTRPGAHFLIGVFLQGLDLGQSISLGYVKDPSAIHLKCLEPWFQNLSRFPIFSKLSVFSFFCGNFLGFVISQLITSYNVLQCESRLGQCCLTPLHMIWSF